MTTPVQRHAPRTLDDHIVAYLEIQDGCVKTTGTIPPPDSCGPGVQGGYGFLQYQPLTVFVVLFFIFLLVKMSFEVLGGGEH